MHDALLLRVPTGIASLDPVLEGGVPPGSAVLLLGEPGAGNVEFVQTLLMRLSLLKRNGVDGKHLLLPENISYVTFTRMQEDILKEIALSFNPAPTAHLGEGIVFHDLSELYFDASIVPPDWYGEGSIMERLQKKQRKENGDILAELARAIDQCPANSLIVLDSLTDIAPPLTEGKRWHAFIAFLRGLQRAAKRRNNTIYLLLTSGILDRSRELEIADCVDATILFRWEDNGAQRRQRVMYFEKFRGVMPRLEAKNLVRFAVSISATEGFEVRNIRMVA
ncbi:RAD55 family ATPase [Methanoculleus horonobensis]|jgi:KaiC/GvpD/RAD55 family RecA-like ATPase|uniref:RAD55 family ATPase n=1 Tax=Methanoculleus horonobensis TaxID=528314 RepID=UPI000834CF3B|nr:RAD55 family ATPase [Methanoculleus horonobensis]MDD3070543.1 RAD55 family ATPase [Methanoculleus horonobensis]MDD4251842.1 RAD55 family ATPase [Methanoculleus horonobensis]